MKYVLVFLPLLMLEAISAQQLSVTEGAVLNSFGLSETSGLMRLNESIYVHNDSGGETALYSIDTISGNVNESTFLNMSTNVDWEDITRDDDFTYVGDFGNNLGNRTNLVIYKLSNLELSQVSGVPDVIEFSYPEQINFDEQLFTTNFDAEALVSWGDELLLFTKNWGNQKTNVYSIPKTPGSHEALLLAEIDVEGFITGGCYDPLADYIILTGYTILEPFVFIIPQGDLSGESMTRISFEVEGGFQIEAIEQLAANKFILTREGENQNVPRIFYAEVDWSDYLDDKVKGFKNAYPNPSSDYVHMGIPIARWTLYSEEGEMLMKGKSQEINVKDLSSGNYLLRVEVAQGIISQRLVVE